MKRTNGTSSGYTTNHLSDVIRTDIPIGTKLIDINQLEEAPKSWNFYTKLSEFKMATLKESILARGGIINPIIVWEKNNKDDNYYIILSGHNRVAAYKEILKSAIEKNYTEYIEKFNKIPAIVKGQFDITENEAMQIIIDCNWAQRELTPMEKHKSIIKKYTLVKENPNTLGLGEGKTRDKIAKDFNISGRQIQRYMSLAHLTEEWQSILSEDDISINLAIKLAKLSIERQEYLFTNHLDTITNHGSKSEKILGSIKTNTTNANIDMLFSNMLTNIENEKNENLENYSIKISFNLHKNDVKKLKLLSKEDIRKVQSEIENIIKAKFLT